MASTKNAAFVIGGMSEGANVDIIAKFQDNKWTRFGSLNTARRIHGSIVSGDQLMVIGGYASS